MDATHFVIVYSDDGNSCYGTAIVGTLTGYTISFGAEYIFNTAFITPNSITTLDASHFIVAYPDYGNSSYGTIIVRTVSGNIISFGSKSVCNPASTDEMSVTALNTTQFVVTFSDEGNLHGTAIFGTLSGSTISYGLKSVFNYSVTYHFSAITLDATHFVVAYCDGSNSDYGTAVVGEVEIPPPPSGNIHITEVYDNKQGKDEGTGFIELWNDTGSPVSLNGYSIVQGTNPGGAGFVAGTYSYPIPAGYTIPDGGFFTIGNGADLNTFNLAWETSLYGTNYDAGNSNLDITNGHAYALNDGSKAILDETPAVVSGARIHQEGGETWLTDLPTDGTQGEFGTDNPLPVVLSSFTAIQTESNYAQLNWTTQSESNLSG